MAKFEDLDQTVDVEADLGTELFASVLPHYMLSKNNKQMAF